MKKALGAAVVIAAAVATGTLAGRRLGYSGMGGDTVVRCRDGHLFTTIWVPGASVKSLRLGLLRFQYCPVGKHWTTVVPLKDSELTDADRAIAASFHDVRIP